MASKKYYLLWNEGGTESRVEEFSDDIEMVECVKKHYDLYKVLPNVYFGIKIDFEPAEVIKSWAIKD